MRPANHPGGCKVPSGTKLDGGLRVAPNGHDGGPHKPTPTVLCVNRTNLRVRELIAEVCDELKATLLEKNLRYGNSFAEPIRVFSKASSRDQVLTRLDDKLSRLFRGSGVETEDTILDVAGYVMLLRVLDRLDDKANSS